MRTGISDFATAIIVVAGALSCVLDGLWRRRAGEGAGAVRARRVADAGTARRAFPRAFFLISADDIGIALEGTIILRRSPRRAPLQETIQRSLYQPKRLLKYWIAL
jgi:hypothetical protein